MKKIKWRPEPKKAIKRTWKPTKPGVKKPTHPKGKTC